MMSVERIWHWINYNPPIFFFIFTTCLLDTVLMVSGEILSWSLMGVEGVNLVMSEDNPQLNELNSKFYLNACEKSFT